MKKIAVITMARNDNFFVERWINYYSEQLGKENIYVFLDGKDQPPPSNNNKANVIVRDHIPQSRATGDKSRITFLSEFARQLFQQNKYDLIIGTDCDEFLVVDPECNQSLKDYLNNVDISTSASALGIDVGQNLDTEKELNPEESILSQRNYALVSSRYTKPIIISKPVNWGSGFHRIKKHNFHIDKNLYLFHLGYCDLKILQQKSNSDRLQNGWDKHLKRRAQTITRVTKNKNYSGEKQIVLARKMQTVLRPFFAWNKPSMGCWKLIIEIPERFKDIFI